MSILQVTTQKPSSGGSELQSTHTILMIEPVAFGFNKDTAVNNYFQQHSNADDIEIQNSALSEFLNMVEKLCTKGIQVIVVKDTKQPHKPDSIFPNNWISFHEGGQVVLYPMFAPNRRTERRRDIIQFIEENGIVLNNIDDFSFWEDENCYLEGTGSMILDRVHKVAYAALSERTDKAVFLQFCCTFGFEPVFFTAYQTVGVERKPIYHTNVMLSIADCYAVVCLESIDNQQERTKVINRLEESGKVIFEISEEQMYSFAGNMLQLKNKTGERFLVLSETAYNSLSENQIQQLKTYNKLIICTIPTIERIGGGSVRCMIAEIF